MRRLLSMVFVAACFVSQTARADATFKLAPWEQWQHQGLGNGPVHLIVGETRIEAKPGEWATLTVPAGGRELVEASVWLGPDATGPRFFLDVEDQHHYTVESDPCCGFQIADSDARFMSLSRCGQGQDRCPHGTVAVNKFVYRRDGCDQRITCAPPAVLRVDGGSVQLSLDDGEARSFTHSYQPLALGRESPVQLTITPSGGQPTTVRALLRLASRYTLLLGATPRLIRDP